MPRPSSPPTRLGSAWEPRRTRSRGTATLSRDAIVAAAVRVLDEFGVDGVSMRRVAGELNAGVTTLYWHVTDKEELLDLVCDSILADIRIPRAGTRSSWESRLTVLLKGLRQALLAHRDLAVFFSARPNVGPNALVLREAIAAALMEAGLDPTQARSADRVLLSYTTGACCAELAAAAAADVLDLDPEGVEAMIGEHLSQLPEDTFPALVELGRESRFVARDKDFVYGLECLFVGIRTTAGPRPRRR